MFTPEEWNELVVDINRKIQDRYYLLNREILARWVWARTLQVDPKSIEIVSELRSMLVEEYNKIVDKHLKDMTDIVPKISKDPDLDKSTPNWLLKQFLPSFDIQPRRFGWSLTV